nr:PDZ domain-containing protein [Planctomycetota bacterium]
PFLGVIVRPTAETDFDGVRGLVVQKVFPRTTATALGLQTDDLIVSCNDTAVASRDDLKAVLEGIAVGDELTVSLVRGEEKQKAVAVMQARPTRNGIEKQVAEAKQAVAKLQEERAAQLNDLAAARTEEVQLAQAMMELSQTLSELPDKLDVAAQQFKAVYPDGEFTVDIVVRISSNKDSADAIDLSPPKATRASDDQAATTPVEQTPAMPTPATGPAPATEPPATEQAPGDDLMPPPTRK